jgi:hypothetical protein
MVARNEGQFEIGRTPATVNTAAAVPDITLQINLSAGDLAYGESTVTRLVDIHRSDVREIVVVADGCRPSSARDLHAPSRFPPSEFAARVERLRTLCTLLQSRRTVDRVVWLEPQPNALRLLNAKYTGIPNPRSHDHLGHAFSAYFLGWDCVRTRYVAHFDADILLWQQPGYSWIRDALTKLEASKEYLAASPRIAPPPDNGDLVSGTGPASGWSDTWPLTRIASGWRSPWFSTRCHLMDRERLGRHLPFCSTRPTGRDAAVTRLLTPFFSVRALSAPERSPTMQRLTSRLPAFPLPPEVLLHEAAQIEKFACVYLDDPRAWFIHPDVKSEAFVRLLPRLIEQASVHGAYPPAQRGLGNVQLAAWENFAG